MDFLFHIDRAIPPNKINFAMSYNVIKIGFSFGYCAPISVVENKPFNLFREVIFISIDSWASYEGNVCIKSYETRGDVNSNACLVARVEALNISLCLALSTAIQSNHRFLSRWVALNWLWNDHKFRWNISLTNCLLYLLLMITQN